jgi:hypothetical protein
MTIMAYTIEDVVCNLQGYFRGYEDGICEDEFEEWANDHFPELHFSFGATRFVIWDDSWRSVLKMNLSNEYNEVDYCQLEVSNYQEACEMGIEKILLETRKLAEIGNGDGIYIQTRYDSDYSRLSTSQKQKLERMTRKIVRCEIFERSKKHCYDNYRISDIWYARAYQLYGKKFMKRFEEWTTTLKIGDLHRNNVGFLNGQPILLDYAGYFGNRARR